MAILTVNNIKKMFGTDVILENVSFEVQKGDRIGLVGINGSGMHTNMSLFRDGKNAFYDPDGEKGLSKVAYSFIAGILAHARARNLDRLYGAARLPRYGKARVRRGHDRI